MTQNILCNNEHEILHMIERTLISNRSDLPSMGTDTRGYNEDEMSTTTQST
jgi:hypothetical protein